MLEINWRVRKQNPLPQGAFAESIQLNYTKAITAFNFRTRQIRERFGVKDVDDAKATQSFIICQDETMEEAGWSHLDYLRIVVGLSAAKPNIVSVTKRTCWVSLRSTQPTMLSPEEAVVVRVLEKVQNVRS